MSGQTNMKAQADFNDWILVTNKSTKLDQDEQELALHLLKLQKYA